MLIDGHPAAVIHRQSQAGGERIGAHAGRPHHGRRGDGRPVVQLDAYPVDRPQARAEVQLEAAPLELAGRIPRQAPAQLGQDLGRDVDEQPPPRHVPQLGVVAARVVAEVFELGHRLHARVAAAHEHEGEPAPPLGLVRGRCRQFELLQDLVSQLDRLGDALESRGVLEQTGNRRGARDRAQGDHQRVEADRRLTALGQPYRRRALHQVDGRDPAQHEPGVRAHHPHRHNHVARLHRPRGRLRQERGVEHEVVRVDQRDRELAAVAPEQPGDVAAGESGAEDDHPSHALQHRSTPAASPGGRCTLRRVSQPSSERPVYAWQTSIGVAVGGTIAAVALIVVFTYVDDYIGSFWAQVLYFAAFFIGVIGLAERSRRGDRANPSRLTDASQPVTPAGLPGAVRVHPGLRRPRRRDDHLRCRDRR